MEIKVEQKDSYTYYKFENRKVDYILHKCPINKEWQLDSERQSLKSRFNTGTVRFFRTLKDIETKIKSLRGISQMIMEG